MINTIDNQSAINANSKVIWLTGLSGSGKTTCAIDLERRLIMDGFKIQILDGDIVRNGINSDLSFSIEDRKENIRRVAHMSKLLLGNGIICINSFITPTKELREMARDIVGKENYIEVFINCPIEVCIERDVKGLYRKAIEGKIHDFTGISSPFEKPLHADVEVNTNDLSIEETVSRIYEFYLNS